MNILTLLFGNLRRGVVTLRFPACPPVREGYRGMVRFEPSRCIGCAVCRFRCTTGAIAFQPGRTEFTWSYDPGLCTFCGRCVEGCKEHALSQEPACPPIYWTAGELKQSWTLPRRSPPAKAAESKADTVPVPGGSP